MAVASLALLLTWTCLASSYTIPDSDEATARRLVFYKKEGTQQQAARTCRDKGGRLVVVDSLDVVEELAFLEEKTGGMREIHTGLIRHDDQELYASDATCSSLESLNFTHWVLETEAIYDITQQCIFVEGAAEADPAKNFMWGRVSCQKDLSFVCVNEVACRIKETKKVSLALVTFANVSAEGCSQACSEMIGCVGTAATGYNTRPPLSHCIFVVTQDDTNPLWHYNCNTQYDEDHVTDAKAFPGVPSDDPDDCVPTNTTAPYYDKRPLPDFIQEAADAGLNGTTPISPSAVVTETQYVTVTGWISVTPTTPLPLMTSTVLVSLVSTVTTTETCTQTAMLSPSNRSEEEMQEALNAVVAELSVDPANVSRARRTKESAADARPSAQTLGGVAVVLLVLIPVLVVLLDLPLLHQDLSRLIRAVKKK